MLGINKNKKIGTKIKVSLHGFISILLFLRIRIRIIESELMAG